MATFHLVVNLIAMAVIVGCIHGQPVMPSNGKDCFSGVGDQMKKSMELLGLFRTARLAENKDLSCVATCLLKKNSVMSEEGAISSEKVLALSHRISDPTFRPVVEGRLSSCITESDTADPCEHGGKFIDCVAKSGSYRSWGGEISRHFQHIFGIPAPPEMMRPVDRSPYSGGMMPNKWDRPMPMPMPGPMDRHHMQGRPTVRLMILILSSPAPPHSTSKPMTAAKPHTGGKPESPSETDKDDDAKDDNNEKEKEETGEKEKEGEKEEKDKEEKGEKDKEEKTDEK